MGKESQVGTSSAVDPEAKVNRAKLHATSMLIGVHMLSHPCLTTIRLVWS